MQYQRPARLTQKIVKGLTRPGRYGSGRGSLGLSLLVKPNTNDGLSKTWSQRIRINRKPVTIGLGSFPVVTVARAHEKALDNAQRVERGEDIRQPQRTIPTVSEAFDSLITTRSRTYTGASTVGNWRRAQRCCKPIASKLVSQVTPTEVIEMLEPIWHTINYTANDVRTKLSDVMKQAIVEGHRTTDPAASHVTRSLGRRKRTVSHATMAADKLGAALAKIRDADDWWAAIACLIFLAFTCVRSGEARLATWDEIDWETATWIIPGTRMKNGLPHRVPLSHQVVELLLYVEGHPGAHHNWIFPAKRGGAMDSNYLSKIMRSLHLTAVPHGLRQTFRNWAGARQTRIPEPAAEMVLAHTPSKAVVRAYLTDDFFEEREPVMQEWADFHTETMGTVVPLQPAESDAPGNSES